jgi:hypothetical protein
MAPLNGTVFIKLVCLVHKILSLPEHIHSENKLLTRVFVYKNRVGFCRQQRCNIDFEVDKMRLE